MKKTILFIMTVFLIAGCNSTALNVTVKNVSDIDRTGETVEAPLAEIQKKIPDGRSFIILNEKGIQVPYQILSDKSSVIFQVDVKAHDVAKFTIKEGTPEKYAPKTFGRFVPERKDDFAWENDRIAYRMYGPALANEYPSNGVDVWVKCTSDLIVNKFYDNDLHHKISYHVDHGEGLDCYKVGHALGAGGIAPYTDTALWVGNHYTAWKVLDNGPLRTTFQLTYDSMQVGQVWLKEVLTISLDAGSQLNKGVVTYEGAIPNNMQLAAGIFLHDKPGVMKQDQNAGYMAYGEVATSDAGVPAGRSYAGVVFTDKVLAMKVQDDHLLGISAYGNKPFTYYFGAGWSKWGFDNDQAWFDYVSNFAKKVQQPLKVSIR